MDDQGKAATEHTPWGCNLILCGVPTTPDQLQILRNGTNQTTLQSCCVENHLIGDALRLSKELEELKKES